MGIGNGDQASYGNSLDASWSHMLYLGLFVALMLVEFIVLNRSGPCGGTTSRTPRASSLLWTAMTESVLLRLEMSSTEC
jgi:hypothetical protein